MKDCIELIRNNATNHPHRIAIIDRTTKTSYEDFMKLVNSISYQLLKEGPNPKVMLDLKQGMKAYALIVAILNIEGTYCPLNPDAPIERKMQIINEFKPNLLVVETQ